MEMETVAGEKPRWRGRQIEFVDFIGSQKMMYDVVNFE